MNRGKFLSVATYGLFSVVKRNNDENRHRCLILSHSVINKLSELLKRTFTQHFTASVGIAGSLESGIYVVSMNAIAIQLHLASVAGFDVPGRLKTCFGCAKNAAKEKRRRKERETS